ncbi:hypothetical protein OAX78_03805 [Planctomycetota bacterium]|nr:hypothetical protein [Planctomycetota bacterium]
MTLEVVPLDSEAIRDEFATFGVEDSHGLVGFDAAGAVKNNLPGHQFSKEDIVAKVDELLQ